MDILRRLLGKRRVSDRLEVELPVVIMVAPDGKEIICCSKDLSPTGLKLDISSVPNLSELTGGHRDLPMQIKFEGEEEPIRVISQPIWTERHGDRMLSGWMFSDYQGDAKERLMGFVEDYDYFRD